MLGIGIYILAWMILWNFFFRGVLPHHADNPAAAGLSTLV